MITTTLAKLKKAEACVERYKFLRKALGKEYKLTTSLLLSKILEVNGLVDTLWALENVVDGGDKICKLFAADCAEHVLHFYTKKYPDDNRPAEAIKAARQFASGKITWSARSAAESAARSAAWSARSAAESAAESAAWSAAWSAARSAESAAWSARSAESAAWSARSAAESAEQKWQTERLVQYLK